VIEPEPRPAGTPPPTRRSTRSVTLTDVASLANVSPQTVSRAIRYPQLVSEHTLQIVQDAISATGYVPNLAASNLASNRSSTVAALIPSLSASVFADALHGLNSVLSSGGYQLFVGSTDYSPEHEEELIRTFMGRRPEGVFIVGTRHTPATALLLKNSGIPVVETWNWTDDPIDNLVGFSNRAAIEAIVDYAVGKGYRHPTFAGTFRAGDFRALDRQASFRDTVARLLPGEPVRVVDSGTDLVDMETGIRLLETTLAEHPETDVLMFSSDVFATGALLECLRRGIPVPERLAITGFGDFEVARYLVPSLTTVAVPNREIGTTAGRLLLDRMAGITTEPVRTDLGFTVLPRNSA
jgi:LacI family transcriptional regulator, gluconate utilization system Gnt-I transcriptional repressor